MALFDELMARAGYVQLAKYGLSLIPDGRIVQAEPRVLPLLDGGSGRRVVGWQAQECPLVAAAPVAAGARVQVAGVVAAHERSGRSSPRGLPPAVIVEDQAEPVPTAEPEDEEWEWQLALARVKIAAAEVERVAQAARAVPPPVPSRRSPPPLPAAALEVRTTRQSPVAPLARMTGPSPVVAALARMTGPTPVVAPLARMPGPMPVVAHAVRAPMVMAAAPAHPPPAPQAVVPIRATAPVIAASSRPPGVPMMRPPSAAATLTGMPSVRTRPAIELPAPRAKTGSDVINQRAPLVIAVAVPESPRRLAQGTAPVVREPMDGDHFEDEDTHVDLVVKRGQTPAAAYAARAASRSGLHSLPALARR